MVFRYCAFVKVFSSIVGGVGLRDVIFVSPEQPLKAYLPIEVTEFPIMILVSPEQEEKALPPIEVTELGRVIFVSPLQVWKALLPIEVT